MVKIGVIVKQIDPVPLVNSMVTVAKPIGSVRICIDLKDLTNAISREHCPLQNVEVVETLNAKYNTKLDATSGFWQQNWMR